MPLSLAVKALDWVLDLRNVNAPDGPKLLLDARPGLVVHLRLTLPHDLHGQLAPVVLPQHLECDQEVCHQLRAPSGDDDAS